MKKTTDWNKWAKYAMFGLLAAAVLLWVVIPMAEIILGHAGNFLFAYIDRHPVGAFLVAAVVGYVAYNCLRTKEEVVTEPAWEPKPDMADYFAVLATVRPAVAEVAEALGLAPIYSHTDMAADAAERILPAERFWRMKYKAPKKSVTAAIDENLARRVLRAQIKTVLERDNPSRFEKTKFSYHGTFEPIIQIDEVQDGDAYINIFAVVASDTYMKFKEGEKGKNILPGGDDPGDSDF